MSRISHNIVANFTARLWSALMTFAFVPVYIRFMGVESFGLVGAFTSLTVVLSVADLGLSTTLNRELAQLSATDKSAASARSLVRTYEYVYWGIGAVLGLAIVALAPLIGQFWFKSDRLSPSSVTEAVALMGWVVVLQWPTSLYSGGLLGLQRQIALNVITIASTTIRAGGASVLLWLVSPTIRTFFMWQLVASGFQTAALAFALWRSIPQDRDAPRFSLRLMHRNWQFAAGLTGISITSVVLTQMDKIVLSRLLNLTAFGYYSLAASVGFGLASIGTPIFAAVFPRMAQLVAQNDEQELVRLYHRSCQIVAMLVVPTCLGIAAFAPEVLALWLRDQAVVRETELLTSVLTIGTMLNTLMLMPLALQLANGWTRLSVIKNICALVAFVPGLLFMTARWGGVGAAAAWVLLNVAYVAIEIPIMHTRVLRQQIATWYAFDFALPLALVIAVVLPSRAFMSDSLSLPIRVTWGITTIFLAFVAIAVGTATGRHYLRQLSVIVHARQPTTARSTL